MILNNILRWLKHRKDKPITNNNTTNNTTTMARKTVISKVLDVDAQDGIIEFPQNRTLYADQFTDNAPNDDEDREGFKPKNMNDVFEHYQPSKNIGLTTEEGGSVAEEFAFKQMKDFDDSQLIAQSELLGEEQAKIDAYNTVIRQLEKNKTLRSTLKDAAARDNLKNALQALMAELDKAE